MGISCISLLLFPFLRSDITPTAAKEYRVSDDVYQILEDVSIAESAAQQVNSMQPFSFFTNFICYDRFNCMLRMRAIISGTCQGGEGREAGNPGKECKCRKYEGHDKSIR